MPLLDHFHLPGRKESHWGGFHSLWASAIVRQLNLEVLPARFVATPNVKLSVFVESDVGTLEKLETGNGNGSHGVALAQAVYAPPKPVLSMAVDWSDLDLFEVEIYQQEGGSKLVAAIELISPANKDRLSNREAFVRKCATYLQEGVSVLIVDVVASRKANLHQELLALLGKHREEAPQILYASSFRTVKRKRKTRLEAWSEELVIGEPLPTLSLWIASDCAVPLDLEESYLTTCESLRIQI